MPALCLGARLPAELCPLAKVHAHPTHKNEFRAAVTITFVHPGLARRDAPEPRAGPTGDWLHRLARRAIHRNGPCAQGKARELVVACRARVRARTVGNRRPGVPPRGEGSRLRAAVWAWDPSRFCHLFCGRGHRCLVMPGYAGAIILVAAVFAGLVEARTCYVRRLVAGALFGRCRAAGGRCAGAGFHSGGGAGTRLGQIMSANSHLGLTAASTLAAVLVAASSPWSRGWSFGRDRGCARGRRAGRPCPRRRRATAPVTRRAPSDRYPRTASHSVCGTAVGSSCLPWRPHGRDCPSG